MSAENKEKQEKKGETRRNKEKPEFDNRNKKVNFTGSLYLNTMKPALILVLVTICLQMPNVQTATAQKFIQIDEQLKAKCEAMSVKRKGFTAVGKYEFGQYRIISGKSGWGKSSTKSPLFGNSSTTKSSVKKSFVLVNNTDTCFAAVSIVESVETYDGSWFSQTFLNYHYSDVKKGEGIFEALFTFSSDTTQWRLAVVYPVASEMDGEIVTDHTTEFRGVVTDGHRSIKIMNVTVNEEGKNPLLNPVNGYEFWLDSESLAAVQVMPINRMNVWIRDDLDNSFKFVLANAVAAMLVKSF